MIYRPSTDQEIETYEREQTLKQIIKYLTFFLAVETVVLVWVVWGLLL